jgi:aminopeptidase
MKDPRIADYARLLVDTCVGVQPGWQVLVTGSTIARPLLEEISRVVAARGAYAFLRPGFGGPIFGPTRPWLQEAPLELIAEPSPLEAHILEHADALIAVESPENTRDGVSVDPQKLQAVQSAYRPYIERVFKHEVPWVGCQYPNPALAQEAGMSTEEFEDFLFGACLLDWDAERERMSRYAEAFDAASEVRIIGEGTDLTLGIEGRSMLVDAGGANIPGGEFFTSPLEDSAEGVITFSEFPAVYVGREMTSIRLRFEGGVVVDASAETNEEFLLQTLDADEGARRVGELGIGCNPGITRYMKNTLFDEKIDGTAHVALGNGLPEVGGTNRSTIHWDIVKDLRPGGQLMLDGAVVQTDGVWALDQLVAA